MKRKGYGWMALLLILSIVFMMYQWMRQRAYQHSPQAILPPSSELENARKAFKENRYFY